MEKKNNLKKQLVDKATFLENYLWNTKFIKIIKENNLNINKWKLNRNYKKLGVSTLTHVINLNILTR